MSTIQNDNIAKLQEGTGTSLLQTPEYQSWLHGETKTILCVGEVGSGKTVLASQVIDTLLQELGHKDNLVLYFFAEMPTQQAKEPTPASILANFLKQLIHHNRNISYQTRMSLERYWMGGNRPTADELLAYLGREIMDTPKIFVVIDALDQLAHSCRQKVLGYLRQLQRNCTMSLMATSRPDSTINEDFANAFPEHLQLEIRQTQEDIEAYMVGQMHRLPDVVMRNTDLQHYIINEIMSLSHGVYVWDRTRRCITDMLRQVSCC